MEECTVCNEERPDDKIDNCLYCGDYVCDNCWEEDTEGNGYIFCGLSCREVWEEEEKELEEEEEEEEEEE